MFYLPTKTQILLEDSSVKNIEDIIVGDKIITHNGCKPVLNINKIKYCNELLELKINNNLKIKIMPKQKFYTSNFCFEQPNIKDSLLSPVIKTQLKSNLTPNQARLLGLYAAEGSLHKRKNSYDNCVIFSFSHLEENTLARLTKELLVKEFSAKVTTKIINIANKCSVDAYAKDIYKFFLKYVGTYSYYKKLHPELVFGSNEIKTQFLLGWLEGDGCIDKYSNRITGTTISPQLAYQTRTMFYNLGIHNGLYLRKITNSIIRGKPLIGKHESYNIRINSTHAQDFIKDSEELYVKPIKTKRLNKFIGNYCIHKLLCKTKVDYDGDMYNLEVEDGSYVANGIIMSN
jgi:hypothetical protein